MPASAAPFGLQMWGGATHADNNPPVLEIAYGAVDIATAMAKGSILNIGASAPTLGAATPTTTRDGNTPWGIVTGFRFNTAPGTAPFGYNDYLPANAITAGFKNIYIQYIPAVTAIMVIQATANTGASTAIGKNAAITYTAPDAVRKVSKIALNAATIATTNTLALKIVGFAGGTDTDTIPNYLVVWNQNVHAWSNILGV